MRSILFIIGGLGAIMTLGAIFLVIDQVVTDEHRASVQASVNNTIEDIEDSQGRHSRGLRGLIASYKALDEGIFSEKPVGIATALPPAPEGWQKLNYDTAHGEALTGGVAKRSLTTGITTDGVLYDFKETAKQREMGVVATYVTASGPILIRLSSSRKNYQIVNKGEARVRDRYMGLARVDAGSKLYATLDGMAIHEAPAINQTRRSSGGFDSTPVDYRRFTFGIGRVIRGEILTRAADEDILALLAGIDIAGLQASLPRPTKGYTAGTGLVPVTPVTEARLTQQDQG